MSDPDEEWLQVVYQFFGHLHGVSHAQLSLIGQVVFLYTAPVYIYICDVYISFYNFSTQSQGPIIGADCSIAR